MKKRNSPLLKRLEQYSALAVPMLATAGLANAQVVYHDINPDVILSSPGDSMLLDLNNDGIFDYAFRTIGYSASWNKVAVVPANVSGVYTIGDQNAIIGTTYVHGSVTVYGYAAALNLGDPIDYNKPTFNFQNLFFTHSGNNTFLFPNMLSVFHNYHFGKWHDGADNFVGFRFTPDGGATFYFGWARCFVSTDATSITIKDYAYQSEQGIAIAAGEGVNIGINNPENDSAITIVSHDRVVLVNFGASGLADANIRLFNILGEGIINRKPTTAQNTIDISHLPAGVYLVQASSEGAKVSKKIMVN